MAIAEYITRKNCWHSDDKEIVYFACLEDRAEGCNVYHQSFSVACALHSTVQKTVQCSNVFVINLSLYTLLCGVQHQQ